MLLLRIDARKYKQNSSSGLSYELHLFNVYKSTNTTDTCYFEDIEDTAILWEKCFMMLFYDFEIILCCIRLLTLFYWKCNTHTVLCCLRCCTYLKPLVLTEDLKLSLIIMLVCKAHDHRVLWGIVGPFGCHGFYSIALPLQPKVIPNAICGICQKGKESNKKGKPEALIHCSQCQNSGK